MMMSDLISYISDMGIMHPSERQDTIRMSKCLSKMLRHRPDLPHDEYGWFVIDEIVQRGSMTREQILELAETNGRYELSPDGEMVRACHGHSIDISYETEVEPPETLYHGTSPLGLEGILRSGAISKMGRTKVHLSDAPEKASFVGGRHTRGTPVLLKVHAGRMHRAGMRFQLSNDGVYLTDRVPIRYVERVTENPIRHVMHVSEESFDRVMDGSRRVEMRLRDDKRRMMMVGDSIVLSCEDRSVLVRIVKLHRFDSFEELYRSIPKVMLGYHHDEEADPSVMNGIYSISRIEEYGVLGIEFTMMDQM